MSDLTERLRERACPVGLAWTGEGPPSADHGHTNCWLFHLAADEIDRLRAERDGWQAETMRALTERDEIAAERDTLREIMRALRAALSEGVVLTRSGLARVEEAMHQADDCEDCNASTDGIGCSMCRPLYTLTPLEDQ